MKKEEIASDNFLAGYSIERTLELILWWLKAYPQEATQVDSEWLQGQKDGLNLAYLTVKGICKGSLNETVQKILEEHLNADPEQIP